MGVMLCFFWVRLKVMQIRLICQHLESRRKKIRRFVLPDVPQRSAEVPNKKPPRKPEYG